MKQKYLLNLILTDVETRSRFYSVFRVDNNLGSIKLHVFEGDKYLEIKITDAEIFKVRSEVPGEEMVIEYRYKGEKGVLDIPPLFDDEQKATDTYQNKTLELELLSSQKVELD